MQEYGRAFLSFHDELSFNPDSFDTLRVRLSVWVDETPGVIYCLMEKPILLQTIAAFPFICTDSTPQSTRPSNYVAQRRSGAVRNEEEIHFALLFEHRHHLRPYYALPVILSTGLMVHRLQTVLFGGVNQAPPDPLCSHILLRSRFCTRSFVPFA